MPIYEYKCDNCGYQLEMLQKISDAPLKHCPECGAESMRKLVSAAAFKLKGTGWYETDFKDKKPKKDSKQTDNKSSTSDKESGKTGNNSETKTDSSNKKSGDTKNSSPKTSSSG